MGIQALKFGGNDSSVTINLKCRNDFSLLSIFLVDITMLIWMNQVDLIITCLFEFCFYLKEERIFTEELYPNKFKKTNNFRRKKDLINVLVKQQYELIN